MRHGEIGHGHRLYIKGGIRYTSARRRAGPPDTGGPGGTGYCDREVS